MMRPASCCIRLSGPTQSTPIGTRRATRRRSTRPRRRAMPTGDPPLTLLALVVAALLIAQPVDADGDRDDQGRVLTWLDLHAEGVADREPLVRNPRDDPVAGGQLPFPVGELAGRLQRAAVGQGDLVAVVERGEVST